MSPPTNIPVVLTIAGSDSGGGAGIQADLKTFHQFGTFGTSVVTAVTAQNTTGVRGIHPVPLDVVRAQLDAVVEDLEPAAVKTGMLANRALAEDVAAGLQRHGLSDYVMDPVMVATSGDRLLEPSAESALRDVLVPLAAVVTPNLEEAALLTGLDVVGEESMRVAARALVEMGAGAALLKGGHLTGDVVVDLLWDGTEETVWRRPRIDTRHTHGTGCTLSAALAAGLAREWPLKRAAQTAIEYLARAIATAPGLGRGRGPVNHFAPPG
jgi:hydroxymethylpyrimidine/phosphomethylpyrimidine kinase